LTRPSLSSCNNGHVPVPTGSHSFTISFFQTSCSCSLQIRRTLSQAQGQSSHQHPLERLPWSVLDLEIFDESGVEIVSVDDLLDNDVLVVREKQPVKDGPVSMAPTSMRPSPWQQHQHPRQGLSAIVRDTPSEPFRRSHDQAAIHPALVNHHHSEPGPPKMSSLSVPRNSTRMPTEHAPSVMVGPPTLSHFIQCNSFGHYFLAEAENLKLPQVPGKSRKAHCVVKVPHASVGEWRGGRGMGGRDRRWWSRWEGGERAGLEERWVVGI